MQKENVLLNIYADNGLIELNPSFDFEFLPNVLDVLNLETILTVEDWEKLNQAMVDKTSWWYVYQVEHISRNSKHAVKLDLWAYEDEESSSIAQLLWDIKGKLTKSHR